MSCPDENTLAGYVGGRLATAQTSAIETHLDDCRQCTATLAALARLSSPHTADEPSGYLPGDRLGRFLIEERLGQGAMGVVVRARDTELNRTVAIKLLTPEATDDVQASMLRERLRREARAMAGIKHDNVITVYEVGTNGNDVYVVMELCNGGTLRQWLEQHRPDPASIVARFCEAARGLDAAHRHGLIHRDFKPDNVLIDSGVAKVADFGLVRSTPSFNRDGSPTPLTASGALLGSPAYMAPEQHLGEGVGPGADQFGFCVALYEALYQQRPFAGDSYVELAMNVLDGNLRARPRGPAVPDRVYAALVRGLAIDPAQRWPSMGALVEELSHRSPPRRRGLILGALVATAVAVFLLVWILRSSDEPARTNGIAQTDQERAVAESKRRSAALMKQMEEMKRNLSSPITPDSVNRMIGKATGMAQHTPPDKWWNQQKPCQGFDELQRSPAPRAIWCATLAGVKNGYYTRWHDNGNLAEQGSYNADRRVGTWIRWHDNGVKAEQAGYVVGERQTERVVWDVNGNVVQREPPP